MSAPKAARLTPLMAALACLALDLPGCSSPRSDAPALEAGTGPSPADGATVTPDLPGKPPPGSGPAPDAPGPGGFPSDSAADRGAPSDMAAAPGNTTPDAAADPCQPVCPPERLGQITPARTLPPATAYTLWGDELLFIDSTRGEVGAIHKTTAAVRTATMLPWKTVTGFRLNGLSTAWLSKRDNGRHEITRWFPGSAPPFVEALLPVGPEITDFGFISDSIFWVSQLGLTPEGDRHFDIRRRNDDGTPKIVHDATLRAPSEGLLFTPTAFYFVRTGPTGNEVVQGDGFTGGPARLLRLTSAAVQLLALAGEALYWIEDDQEIWRAPTTGSMIAARVTSAPVRGRFHFGALVGGRVYFFGEKQSALVLANDQARVLVQPRPNGEHAAVAVDETHLIWLDDGGQLWRVKL